MCTTLRTIRGVATGAWVVALSGLSTNRALAYTLSAPQRVAFVTLQHTDYFAVGGVGAAGTTSGSEAALRVLLTHPHCGLVLQDLLKTARVEGQLYALVGLKMKAPALYRQNIPTYAARRESVSVVEGCIPMTEAASVVAAKIQHGDYDQRLRRPQNPPRKSIVKAR